jgi:predicted transcriptional regulator
MTQISIRTDSELVGQFDAVASATGRTRSFLVNEAMREYIAREIWQVAEIHKALAEADADDFATDAEMATLDKKWGRHAG